MEHIISVKLNRSWLSFDLFGAAGVSKMKRLRRSGEFSIMMVALLAGLATPAFGQQEYVGRFGAYGGYVFLDSPHIKLFENGVQLQFGMNMRRWLGIGLDFSKSAGDSPLTPDMLPTPLQQLLAAQLQQMQSAGTVPMGYVLSVPTHSRTETYALGPQLYYRHWAHFTPFIRPSIGALHQVTIPHPTDAISTAVVAELVPSGKKEDWTGFYGVGGGADIWITRHFAVRTQADLAYNHLYNDLLKDGRYTVRFSIGPYFSFGRNVTK